MAQNYCGKCGYNFEGQSAKFCPKCGYCTTNFPTENIQQEGMGKTNQNLMPKQQSDIINIDQLPFILNYHEKIVDIVKVHYAGEDIILQILGSGVGYSGQSGFGVGMGSATSKPMKRITDKKMCKLYITTQRLVFISIDGGLISKETLGKVHTIIPVENIERVQIYHLVFMHLFGIGADFIGISVSTPKGNLDIHIKVQINDDFKKRPIDQQNLKYWIDLLTQTAQNRKSIGSATNQDELNLSQQSDNNPILILKSRLSKGEISEEEFIRIKKLLE